MSKDNTIYYLTFENIKDTDILFNDIYSNEDTNYYFCDDFSKDFYIYLARCGFICTSTIYQDKLYLLPEMQFEYALLDFENLHISKKVKKLIKQDDYEFTSNTRFKEVIEKIDEYHEPNWLIGEYKSLLINLHKTYDNNDFKLVSYEIIDKHTKQLIAAEIGYKIYDTYTSLTGFSSKDKKYNNYGKLQLVLLAQELQKEGFSFWNLGHPYMQYKFDLGAVKYSRNDFLKRWLPKVFI
ncbi:hypothetical protein LPB137_01530 [Poseidonibacter parvus]|uniref:Leucyl/phenylalanyl-tRNA--protein transferase n=1 Tax=Poseidonibacter parvus TaxID=1850254 RepID=A0A1P8KJ81_9BACT|nr:hypothetical protein [Poseidonibacter parvus]APW64611.1 hypothetical protein LPB137_01530 [Poseidonibacter parvus]